MKKILPLLLTAIALHQQPVWAADAKTEESSAAKSTVTLDQFKLGTTVANDPVTMDSLKGKVVVLEMWGIHCGPCIASMPGLDALYKRNKDKGFMLVGLHSQQATDEEIQTKVKQLKVKFPITTGGGGPHEGNGIPHSLVFDAQGKLVFEGHPTDAAFEKSVKKALKDVTASASAPSGLKSTSGLSSSSGLSSAKAKPAALIAQRPWTNTDGKVMNAALISVEGANATFKKVDGKTFSYPLNKLNEEDQATIKEAAEKSSEATAAE